MRIAISGSHSVGKTSLLNAIGTPYIKIDEVARQVIQDKLPTNMTDDEFFDFEMRIAKQQIELENSHTNFIIDRSIYDIMAYTSQRLSQYRYNKIKNYLLDNSNGYDIIFYLPIEFPIEKDPKRTNDENYRQEIDKRIQHLFLYNELPVHILTGSLEQRLESFYKIIKKYDEQKNIR